MRIGIITQPLRINYGGILQNYALQKILKEKGHEVVTLDPIESYQSYSVLIQFAKYVKRFIAKYIFRKKGIAIFYEKKLRHDYPIISQNMKKFVNRYINVEEVNDYSELDPANFDALLVGSDQVWRPKYNKDIGISFLSFARTWIVKRIAYAASFGTDVWEFSQDQTKLCSDLIKLFDSVSVREFSGVDMCKKYFGVDPQLVLDPTMLLNKEDYMKLVSDEQRRMVPKDRLLCCILDNSDEKNSIIKSICDKLKLSPLFTYKSNLFDETCPVEDRIQPSVEEWLSAFENSEFVVTDSYHATVFSILFKKQFITIGNDERGLSRLFTLLNQFDLENRLIKSKEELVRIEGVIDYDRVSQILMDLRGKSLDFINSNFN